MKLSEFVSRQRLTFGSYLWDVMPREDMWYDNEKEYIILFWISMPKAESLRKIIKNNIETIS